MDPVKKKLLEKIELQEELKRRAMLRKDHYVPNKGQKEVHLSEKKVRLVVSGNGAGKSCMALHEAVWALQGFNPITKKYSTVPARIICVLDRPSKINDQWLPEAKKWYDTSKWKFAKRGKPYYEQIILPNGSELIFMFHDQDPMAFESIELDMAIFDEPCPRHVYIGLRRGGRKKGHPSRYLMIGTPLAASWIRKDIYDPWAMGRLTDTDCFKFSSYVNKENLGDGELESLEAVLTEKERRVRILGEFFDLDGLALAHLFNRDVHLIDPPAWPNGWPCVVSIDPHGSKPHYASLLGVDPDGFFYYLKEISSKSAPSDFALELKEFYKGFTVVDIVCDSLGASGRSGGVGNKSFIEVLNDNGVRTRSTTFSDKKDEAWVNKIQEVMRIPLVADNLGRKLPLLSIHKDCKGIINDIETVEWVRIKNSEEFRPKLDIANKDYLATLKYALASNLSYTKGHEDVIGRPPSNFQTGWRGFSPK